MFIVHSHIGNYCVINQDITTIFNTSKYSALDLFWNMKSIMYVEIQESKRIKNCKNLIFFYKCVLAVMIYF